MSAGRRAPCRTEVLGLVLVDAVVFDFDRVEVVGIETEYRNAGVGADVFIRNRKADRLADHLRVHRDDCALDDVAAVAHEKRLQRAIHLSGRTRRHPGNCLTYGYGNGGLFFIHNYPRSLKNVRLRARNSLSSRYYRRRHSFRANSFPLCHATQKRLVGTSL